MDNLSKRDYMLLLDFVQGTIECSTHEEFKCLVKMLTKLVPFDYAACVLRTVDPISSKEQFEIVNINYPEEWLKLYVSENLNRVDPIVIENFKRFGLQYWADTYQRYKPPRKFIDIANSFGLTDGYTIGVRNARGTEASLFSISGRYIERDKRTEECLMHIIQHVHQVVVRIAGSIPNYKKVLLSPKEKEVIRWVAMGKSSWDISIIMGISERTVNFHVASIMQKLEAVTRAHAVAIAYSLRLL
jgi:DNA-binding CsgD family transcriptional regulator